MKSPKFWKNKSNCWDNRCQATLASCPLWKPALTRSLRLREGKTARIGIGGLGEDQPELLIHEVFGPVLALPGQG